VHDKNMRLMVVMLEELVQHSLPRLFSIQRKMEVGYVLLGSELDFISDTLKTVSKCYNDFNQDKDCVLIFTGVASLLTEVVEQALINENQDLKIAV